MSSSHSHRYTKQEEQFIIDNYQTMQPKDIADKLNISVGTLYAKAKALHLKKRLPDGQFRANLEILLNESLQSMYWIGFLLADGHFHKLGNRITLGLSIKDLSHLTKFIEYVEGITQPKIIKSNSFDKTNESVYISYSNKKIVSKIREKYNIDNNKTKNPPDFSKYNLTDDQWLALIIGFIDGDGTINRIQRKQYNYYSVRFEIDHSWLNNLTFIKSFLYNKCHKTATIPKKRNDRETVIACIGSTDVIKLLTDFIVVNNLYVLNRKWNTCLNYHSKLNEIV